MIISPHPQGSQEWIDARLGIPTASNYDRIVSPKTLKPLGQGAHTYLCQLVYERLAPDAITEDNAVSGYIDRGREMQEMAEKFYEFQRDVPLERCGFIYRDDKLTGCSPDGLVGSEGGIEIKTPKASTHIDYLLAQAGDKNAMMKYRCQVQGCIWVAEREWWDLMSFHPELPPVLIRCERDEKVITALEKGIYEFIERLDEAVAKLEKKRGTP